jgi:hypothetical protein
MHIFITYPMPKQAIHYNAQEVTRIQKTRPYTSEYQILCQMLNIFQTSPQNSGHSPLVLYYNPTGFAQITCL